MKDSMQNVLNSSLNDNLLLQKQFEIMIDTNNKKIANELNRINSMISKLNEEILEVKKQICSENRAPLKTETEPAGPIVGFREIKEENKGVVKSDSAKDSPVSKPRYGDYKSEDVAIDKFFYFGSKKAR